MIDRWARGIVAAASASLFILSGGHVQAADECQYQAVVGGAIQSSASYFCRSDESADLSTPGQCSGFRTVQKIRSLGDGKYGCASTSFSVNRYSCEWYQLGMPDPGTTHSFSAVCPPGVTPPEYDEDGNPIPPGGDPGDGGGGDPGDGGGGDPGDGGSGDGGGGDGEEPGQCPEGQVTNEITGACEVPCPEGQIEDPFNAGQCIPVCPPDQEISEDGPTLCVCKDDNKILNDALQCIDRCYSSFFAGLSASAGSDYPQRYCAKADFGASYCWYDIASTPSDSYVSAGVTIYEYPATLTGPSCGTLDDSEGAYTAPPPDCPAGQTWDNVTRACEGPEGTTCPPGYDWSAATNSCSSPCPSGTTEQHGWCVPTGGDTGGGTGDGDTGGGSTGGGNGGMPGHDGWALITPEDFYTCVHCNRNLGEAIDQFGVELKQTPVIKFAVDFFDVPEQVSDGDLCFEVRMPLLANRSVTVCIPDWLLDIAEWVMIIFATILAWLIISRRLEV